MFGAIAAAIVAIARAWPCVGDGESHVIADWPGLPQGLVVRAAPATMRSAAMNAKKVPPVPGIGLAFWRFTH